MNAKKNNAIQSPINRDQLLTVGDLMDFKTGLLSEFASMLKENKNTSSKQWLRSSEVRKMLSISAGTLQNFRVSGTLTFSKVGGIVFYKYEDVVALLESNSSSKLK